jgi:RNA polymerase sigma-70 factor (ECF subfamily)
MDADHFEQIVARHYEPLFRFALSLTRVEADARDLTQHAFYVWATKGHQLRDQSKAKAWLFTTLHRAFLTSRRTHTRFTHHALEDVPIHDLPVYAPDFVNAVDSPQVLAALAKVDAVYQAALALFYLEDWSYYEIAQILEVPLGTVKSRIARGIRQLRQIFESLESKRSTDDHYQVDQAESARMSDRPAKLSERKVNKQRIHLPNHSLGSLPD